MVNGYDWEDYCLIICVHNRFGSYSYLVKHTSQEEFFERYVDYWQQQGRQDGSSGRFDRIEVIHITEDSFNLLAPNWTDDFKIGE